MFVGTGRCSGGSLNANEHVYFHLIPKKKGTGTYNEISAEFRYVQKMYSKAHLIVLTKENNDIKDADFFTKHSKMRPS